MKLQNWRKEFKKIPSIEYNQEYEAREQFIAELALEILNDIRPPDNLKTSGFTYMSEKIKEIKKHFTD